MADASGTAERETGFPVQLAMERNVAWGQGDGQRNCGEAGGPRKEQNVHPGHEETVHCRQSVLRA